MSNKEQPVQPIPEWLEKAIQDNRPKVDNGLDAWDYANEVGVSSGFIRGAKWAYRFLCSEPFFFTQDGSCHWYMIPVEKRLRWQQLNNRLPEIEGWDEYDYDSAVDEEFAQYRTNGGISHIEFIPIPSSDNTLK